MIRMRRTVSGDLLPYYLVIQGSVLHAFYSIYSGIHGLTWKPDHSPAFSGAHWHGPHQSRPTYLHPGKAVAPGNVRRLPGSP